MSSLEEKEHRSVVDSIRDVIRDLSGRRQMEEKLRRSEKGIAVSLKIWRTLISRLI